MEDALDDAWEDIRPSVVGGRGRSRDLRGKTFGRLKPQKKLGRDKHGSALWECLCVCGNTRVVSRANLRKGRVKSCGCLLKEMSP
jgi:hypothetical protein